MDAILMVTRPMVPPWVEGSKNTAWQIAANAERHRFHLLTAQQEGDLPGIDSITWQRIYSGRKFSMQQRFRLLLYLIGNDLDVDTYHFLFVPTLLTSSFLSALVKLKHKCSIQTVPSLYTKRLSPNIVRKLFFADRVVVLSDWTANYLRSLGIRRVVRINAGINLDFFSPPDDRLSLRGRWALPKDKVIALFSGELTRLGSLEIMLAIVPKVLAANSHLHLVFACPTRKPEDLRARQEAQDWIRQQGYEDSVTFLGDIDDFPSLLKACDMLLFPVATMTGKIDTPLTVLEAMATEVPVILTDLPPLNEVLKTDCGIAITPRDNNAFVQAILELADDKERRQKMGANGRRTVEECYNLQQMVRAYEDLYSEIT